MEIHHRFEVLTRRPAADGMPTHCRDSDLIHDLIGRIQRGDERGELELRGLFDRGVRLQLQREAGMKGAAARAKDVALVAVRAIKRYNAIDVDTLLDIVRRSVRYHAALHREMSQIQQPIGPLKRFIITLKGQTGLRGLLE